MNVPLLIILSYARGSTQLHFLLALFVGALVRGNRLPLDATELHLFLELVNVANARKKVRLSPLIIIIKGRKPLAPLLLGRLSFLKIANDGELERRVKACERTTH